MASRNVVLPCSFDLPRGVGGSLPNHVGRAQLAVPATFRALAGDCTTDEGPAEGAQPGTTLYPSHHASLWNGHLAHGIFRFQWSLQHGMEPSAHARRS